MFSEHKNSYLQLHCSSVNPRIINRSVNLALEKPTIDGGDFEPPLNRLSSEQPCIPIANLDVTRRPLAFGRLALPKLRRELHAEDENVRIAALTTIYDLVKNPERGYEAIKLRIPDRMADLLGSENPVIRERTILCLTVMAELADGKEAIVKNSRLLTQLAILLDDVEGIIRHKAACCVEMISRFWKATEDLVSFGFVPILLDCAMKDCEEIAILHLKTLYNMLVSCDGLEQILEFDGYNTIRQIFDSSNPELKASAAKCLAIIFSSPEGREIAYKENVLIDLNKLLHSDIVEVYQAAAEAIMYATVKSAAKIKATRITHLPDRLVQLLHDYDNPTTLFYCFQALTNISEHPIIRKYVFQNHYEELSTLYVGDDKDLSRMKDNLLNVVGWVPDSM